MKRMIFTVTLMFCIRGMCFAQAVALDRLGKDKWLKYSGGISAMGVFYDGSASRDPFGYMVRGNIDITLAGIYRLPFSFSYSDQQWKFPSPIRLNRFSFHPSYKGLQLHFGDAAMSFSPYTLNGHQFTGFGAEFRARKHWSLGLMYGRLLKEVAYQDDLPGTAPVWERRGYGIKVSYDSSSWKLSGSILSARDLSSGVKEHIEKYPFPEQNLVVGIQGGLQIFQKGRVLFDYAHSVIGFERKGMEMYRETESYDSVSRTEDKSFRAFKVSLNYPALTGDLSLAYERIDPGYRTFGAYYFNADLENISVTAGQSLFRGKVNLQLRSGVQRDNLDGAGKQEFRRLVNALNISVSPGDHVSFNVHYSNFATHTNTRDQFDHINRGSSLEIVDTLSYRQLAQQASLSVQYRTSPHSGSSRNLSMLLNFQENRNENTGSEAKVKGDHFYQGALQYQVQPGKGKTGYAFTINSSLHTGEGTGDLTWGPGVSAGKTFADQRWRTRMTLAYNRTEGREGFKGSVFNTRLNALWTIYERHQLGVSALYQYREQERFQGGDLTVQFTYNYRLDNFRLQLQDRGHTQNSTQEEALKVKFRYRDVIYSGTFEEVNRQLALVSREPWFALLPGEARKELDRLKTAYLKQEKRGAYKFHALHYLAALYHYGDAIAAYYDQADMAIRKIIHDMKGTDHELERRYVHSKGLFESARAAYSDTTTNGDIIQLEINFEECRSRLKGHRWLEKQLQGYGGLTYDGPVHPAIRTYLESHLQDYTAALTKGEDPVSLRSKLEIGLIDHFYQSSLKHTPKTRVVLRYHNLKSK